MVTAGVQTGRTSIDHIPVPNPRESQLSFSLSDLSDEEVDRRITRLTQEVKRISSNSKVSFQIIRISPLSKGLLDNQFKIRIDLKTGSSVYQTDLKCSTLTYNVDNKCYLNTIFSYSYIYCYYKVYRWIGCAKVANLSEHLAFLAATDTVNAF